MTVAMTFQYAPVVSNQLLNAGFSINHQDIGSLTAGNQPASAVNTVIPQIAPLPEDSYKIPQSKNISADNSSRERSADPGRSMSHIVVTYNYLGKMRTKYVDSHNNSIYQIPSEMAAYIQNLMMTVQDNQKLTLIL